MRNGGSAVLPVTPPGKLYVTVWAVVELPWGTLTGPPLHLGPASLVPKGTSREPAAPARDGNR